MLNEKERLLAILQSEDVDRPAVICPGGMMSAATTKVLEKFGERFHSDPEPMAEAALEIRRTSGFENLGVPFCLTVEAEVLGSRVDTGDASVEPLVTQYGAATLDDMLNLPAPSFQQDGRLSCVIEAIRLLTEKSEETPIIGNLTGPLSLATSIMDPMIFFRLMGKEKKGVQKVLDHVIDFLVLFAREQIRAGADVISIADPSATGDILGPANFRAFVVPGLNRLATEIKRAGAGCIIHVCGRAGSIVDEFNDIGSAALSFDSIVSMKKVRERVPGPPLMGNLSTHMLHTNTPEKINRATRRNMESGVEIVSPACGISLSTPHENLRAMTDTVKGL